VKIAEAVVALLSIGMPLLLGGYIGPGNAAEHDAGGVAAGESPGDPERARDGFSAPAAATASNSTNRA
jgi:hypothetical protein